MSVSQVAQADPPARPTARAGGRAVALVAASFSMLFTELALIRWAAAYVVYLAYFTNFVLLASFLGIGLGFLRPQRAARWVAWAPLAVAAVGGFILLFPVRVAQVDQVRGFAGLFGMFALPIWVTLPIIFVGVVVAMACIASRVGALLGGFPPLEAYRLDILGSIAGTVAFATASLFQLRPAVWGLAIAGGLWAAGGGATLRRLERIGLLAVGAVFLVGSLDPADSWSPYYRVTSSDTTATGNVGVKVNGIPHQSIEPLDRLIQDQPYYLYPYGHLPGGSPGDVLIVGAGTGNDVSVALSQGATHVDAVEIDPVLQRIGEDRHPNHPYDDPRVTEIVNDGRAFLENTDRTYDLILFALPDSLTLVSGQSSLRLESYLFTVQSFGSVKEHLRPQGVFGLYNYYFPIVFARLSVTMQRVFGHAPCFDRGDGSIGTRQQSVLTIGLTPSAVNCGTLWHPTAELGTPRPATDDYPFPYLKGRTIPLLYLITLALILMATALAVRVVGRVTLRSMRRYSDLFFMGTAFLLLETKNVVQFALLFGTTWFVNALVILGVLLAVLLAIEVTRRIRLPSMPWLYALLFASLAVAWLVPQGSLLSLGIVPRFFAAAALAFAPVFVANLVFAERFRETASASTALGVNLFGAMLGGVLEYGALLVGYRALLVIAAVAYALALMASRSITGRPVADSAA
ncbi:MAG: spermidine synthase, partial [Actinobacteria bacterium]|nr:spermidine synthase [Actinomycetota bacterium]